MANTWYDEGRNGILGGAAGAAVHAQPELFTNDIRVGLRDTALAVNVATQIDLADVVANHEGTSTALTGRTVGTVAVGVFDHADEVFTAVTGVPFEGLDYYDFATAVNTTAPLLWHIDGWTGLPLTPNGGDITLAPAAGGVYSLNAT